jgi:hypothetical protein
MTVAPSRSNFKKASQLNCNFDHLHSRDGAPTLRWRKSGQQPAAPSVLPGSRLTAEQIQEAMLLFLLIEREAISTGY